MIHAKMIVIKMVSMMLMMFVSVTLLSQELTSLAWLHTMWVVGVMRLLLARL